MTHSQSNSHNRISGTLLCVEAWEFPELFCNPNVRARFSCFGVVAHFEQTTSGNVAHRLYLWHGKIMCINIYTLLNIHKSTTILKHIDTYGVTKKEKIHSFNTPTCAFRIQEHSRALLCSCLCVDSASNNLFSIQSRWKGRARRRVKVNMNLKSFVTQ